MKQVQGLEGKAGLEWIADKAKKFSDNVSSDVDDFMYKTLNACVGSNASARSITQCEQLANWRAAGQPNGTLRTILNCGNSFSAATRVMTRAGLIAIASLSVGTPVLAWNENTNQQGYYPIEAVHRNIDHGLTNLTLEANGVLETIETTPEHPFYLETAVAPISRPAPLGHAGLTKFWVGAGHLEVGDVVRRSSGRLGVVRGVVNLEGSREMYNLSVGTAGTYFVGAGEWLVHNCDLLPDEDLAKLSIQFASAIREGTQIRKGGTSGIIQSSKNGKIYFGISGDKDILNDLPQFAGKPLQTGERVIDRIHPDIKDLYQKLGVVDCEGRLAKTNALCAEAKALTRMLYDGHTLQDLKGSISVAVSIDKKASGYLDIKEACVRNCQPVLGFLEMVYLERINGIITRVIRGPV
ncbi:MAG: hypothetical protein HC933_09995 [Pleurocapsa sp. SU_196_0]|nr:hypothetical protein [Pleurocapsa sp. SU_196_0]